MAEGEVETGPPDTPEAASAVGGLQRPGTKQFLLLAKLAQFAIATQIAPMDPIPLELLQTGAKLSEATNEWIGHDKVHFNRHLSVFRQQAQVKPCSLFSA